MAARIVLLLAGLALGGRGDVRARDPEVQDKPGTVPGHSGWERVIPAMLGTPRHGGEHGHKPADPMDHETPLLRPERYLLVHGAHHGGPEHHPVVHGTHHGGPEHLPIAHGTRLVEPEHRPIAHGTRLVEPEHHPIAHGTHLVEPEHHPLAHRPPPDGPAYGPLGPPKETASPTGESGAQHHPARTGNWCAFVQNRVVTTAVSCGTEKYTIKSQSPCPNGTPDCQLVMYKLSTRPVYRQQQKIFTALLWRCCPGHTGHNCEETLPDEHASDPSIQTAGSALPGASAARYAGGERLTQLAGDQNREQNDFQLPGSPRYHHLEGEPSVVASTSISDLDLSDFDYEHDQDHNQDHNRGRDHNQDRDREHDQEHNQDHDREHDREHNQNHDREQDRDHNQDHNRGRDYNQDRDRRREHNQDHDREHDQEHNQDHDREQDRVHNQNHDRDDNQDHDRNHNHDHNHNRSHDRDHNLNHDRDRSPDQDHNQDRSQDRDHNPNHDHDRSHDHNQDRSQDRDHNPNHDHDRSHDQDHNQDRHHNPNHDHDHDHDSSQDRDHKHDRSHDRDHNQEHDRSHDQTDPVTADTPPGTSPFPDAAQLLPLPQMMEVLMAQLAPVLDGFNRTLERLAQEVGGLSQDLARLRQESEDRRQTPEAGEGDFEAKLEESLYQIDQVKEELRLQRADLEDRLHSQQAMLHYNLTNFKTDVDVKIKRNQKTMQINVQSLNASLTQVRLDHERLEEEVQRGSGSKEGASHDQLEEGPAVWDAISKLDNKVVNNTVKVNALLEDLDLASKNIQDLQRGFRGLEGKIDQTGRDSQIQFMETGLEVEAAKVEVLNRVNELASNLTLQDEQLKEMDSDMDYLYTQFYRNNATSRDCDCKALSAGLSQLEREVANVTELASENRQALEDSTVGQDRWEVGWGTSVEDLKQGLLQVKESLAFEQDKSRSLHLNMSQLLASHLASRQEVRGLQESDEKKAGEMRRLASSFSSLLKDAIRHTEVLEVLLGEEVLEFKERPLREQEEYAIPLLRERIQHTLVQIKHQNVSLTALLKSMQAEDPAGGHKASEPTEWGSRGLKRRSGDHLPEYHREEDLRESPMGDRPDYSVSDFWSLGKEVEDLDAKVSRLEEQRCISCCNCSRNAAPGGLEEELASLRRGLEDHLRMFKNVFSNMDGLTGSEGTLDLDKLWALLKKKEAKKQRKHQKEKEVELGEGHGGMRARSKREAFLEMGVLAQMADAPLAFLASAQDGAKETGAVIFDRVSLNRGRAYSAGTGTFRAPAAGTYLFAVRVEFGPGPSLAYLRRGGAVAVTLRQDQAGPVTRVCVLQLERGEELRFELSEGTVRRGNLAENTFAGLLLSSNT